MLAVDALPEEVLVSHVLSDPQLTRCPAWCAVRHGSGQDEGDLVHISGALLVQRTVLRLCTTIDPDGDVEDGPFVLVGSAELTLHEAEALIAALTQLVDEGRGSLSTEQPQRALAVLDP
jgi:hypothetical protein